MKDLNLHSLTQTMDQLKDQKARLEFELKNIDEQISKVEIELKNILSKMGVESIDYGVYTFGWTTTTSKRFNQKAFGAQYPDLLEKFKLPSQSRRFEFKING